MKPNTWRSIGAVGALLGLVGLVVTWNLGLNQLPDSPYSPLEEDVAGLVGVEHQGVTVAAPAAVVG